MLQEPLDRTERSVGSKRPRFHFLVSVLMLTVFLCVLISHCARSRERPAYTTIVGELPSSAQCVNYEMVQFGFDYSHLLEFSVSDEALLHRLVREWELRDLSSVREVPTSFVRLRHPDWWTPSTPSPSREFGRDDDENERYWSVWVHDDSGRLYVEVGRW